MKYLVKMTVVSAIFLCAYLPVSCFAQEPKTTAVAALDLQNLRWILGSWHAKNAKQSTDEHWSLQGDSLLGISRTTEENKSKAFELLLIEKLGDDLILRLRFFGPAIDKATRGKEEPLRLKVVQADAQQLVCEGIGGETGTTLTYTKLSANSMQAQIRKVRDGAVVWQESYAFNRISH